MSPGAYQGVETLKRPGGWARGVAGALLPAAILIAAAALAHRAGLADLLGQESVDGWIRGHGPAGWLLFVGLAGLATALAVPRQAASFMGGYAFGFLGGSLLALAAAGLGCALGFWYARLAGRAWLPRRRGARMARLEELLRRDPFGMALLIRLLPVGNNFLTNLLAGVCGVPFRPFLSGSLLGYAPQTLIFALLGSGITVAPAWRVSLSVFLLAVSALLGCRMYRKSVLARALGAGA